MADETSNIIPDSFKEAVCIDAGRVYDSCCEHHITIYIQHNILILRDFAIKKPPHPFGQGGNCFSIIFFYFFLQKSRLIQPAPDFSLPHPALEPVPDFTSMMV